MEIELRQMRQCDFRFAWNLYELLIKELTQELLPWRYASQKAVVRNAVESGDGRIVVIDDQQVGWLQVHEDERQLYIAQMYLKPEFQSLGIGSRLVGKLIERARASEKELTLSVMKNNSAKRFYKRLGFVIVRSDQYKHHMTYRQD